MKDKEKSTFVLLGYAKYFYDRYCRNCPLDKNKCTDPTCKFLNGMMEGENPPDNCKGREGK